MGAGCKGLWRILHQRTNGLPEFSVSPIGHSLQASCCKPCRCPKYGSSVCNSPPCVDVLANFFCPCNSMILLADWRFMLVKGHQSLQFLSLRGILLLLGVVRCQHRGCRHVHKGHLLALCIIQRHVKHAGWTSKSRREAAGRLHA